MGDERIRLVAHRVVHAHELRIIGEDRRGDVVDLAADEPAHRHVQLQLDDGGSAPIDEGRQVGRSGRPPVLGGSVKSLDTHRATIEILHLMGATDVQVARLFQRRIALDALSLEDLKRFRDTVTIRLHLSFMRSRARAGVGADWLQFRSRT